MKKKELIKQLNSLKKTIKPDLNWQSENREILYAQIKAQTQQLDLKFSYWQMFNFSKFALNVARPIGSLIVVILIVFGTWIASVGATKNSLPGDLLYPVKITTERVKVNLTLNDEKRANLEIAFAERRINEIKKVVEQDSKQNTSADLDVPLKQFQESMVNVKSNLAKLEIKDKEKAFVLANLIDEKTDEYVSVLMTNQDKLPQLSADTTQAINASKNIGQKAFDLLIQEAEEGNEDEDMTAIRQKVDTKITNLANTLALAEVNLDKIKSGIAAAESEIKEESSDVKESVNEETVPEALTEKNTSDQIEQPEPVKETEAESQEVAEDDNQEDNNNENGLTIQQVTEKLSQANTLLAQAKELLTQDKISQAYDLVKQVDEITAIIKQFINNNQQYLTADSAEPVSGEEAEDGNIIGIFSSEK